MITVDSTPPLVALSGNPIRFGLSTDNNIETAATQTRLNLIFTAKGAANDVVHLTWGNEDISFTCKASPDDSGTQIPDGSGSATLANWVAAVIPYLAANYYINRDWTLVQSTGQILMYGTVGNVSDPSANFTWADSGNEPTYTKVAGVAELPRSFFKIGMQVLLKVSGTYENIGEDILPVNADGEALFDIHKWFADRIYPEFKYPEASDQIMIARANSSGDYKVRYWEQYGSPIVARMMATTNPYFVLYGGVSTLQQAIYNRQASNFWAKLGYNQYFLTWQPTDKLVDRWTTEKLYYLVRSSLASIKLKIEINYNDETAQSTITKTTVNTPVQYGVYEIAVSLNVLQVTGYDGTTIANYRVWIEDSADNRISEIRKFTLDYTSYEEVPRQFLFLNSLGGFDTLRITGEVEDNLDYQRSSITKVLGADFTELDHQATAGSITESRIHKANTGWKTREDIAWIRDFFLSKQVYQLVVGKLVPVEILTTQARQRMDREDLFSIDFEYRRSYRSEHYSREIVTAEFTDAFDDDFANE